MPSGQQPFIVVRDKTPPGGTVVTGDATSTMYEKKAGCLLGLRIRATTTACLQTGLHL